MYPSKHAREMAILLRISHELDVVGDVTATLDSPSELIAWATILDNPTIAAWRAQDSGHRYIQVTAEHHGAPIRGRIAAVLRCEPHPEFWQALDLAGIHSGVTRTLSVADLSAAWEIMPVTPAHLESRNPTPPANTGSPSEHGSQSRDAP